MSLSVASLLLHRSVWERIGGFVEGFRTGEDLIFVRRVLSGGFKIGITPDAVVHWQIPGTLRGTFHRIVNYSHYTLEAGLGYTWHARAFVYYAMAILLLAMGIIYSPWWLAVLAGCAVLRVLKTVHSNEKTHRGLRAYTLSRVLLVGWILLAVDAASLCGAFRWLRQLSTPRKRLHGRPGQPRPLPTDFAT
jgi:GT2 family glycosyltransferase